MNHSCDLHVVGWQRCIRRADRKFEATTERGSKGWFYACDPFHALEVRRWLTEQGMTLGRTLGYHE